MQDARIAGEVFVPTPVPTLFTSRQTPGAAVGLGASHYNVALKPGTSTQAYISALTRVLGPGYDAYTPAGPSVTAQINTSYFRCWRCWSPCWPGSACSTPCSWPPGNAPTTSACTKPSG
jgi:hypothetical protein